MSEKILDIFHHLKNKRKNFIYTWAQALGPVKKSKTPSIIHELGVSPEWDTNNIKHNHNRHVVSKYITNLDGPLP
jgi:hypothetical protein